MKKSIISASIAAMIGGLGFVAVANAAVLAPRTGAATGLTTPDTGLGNILFVPYFTTQGTNATLLNIVNTDTANGKVVKVRFRGAANSDDLFDFTLLLSPGDVWTAKVSQGADGISKLETSDKSCTLPAIVATQTNSFGTSRLNPALSAADKAAGTREGYIEILNMADVPKLTSKAQEVAVTGPTATVVNGVTTNSLWTAIKHVSGTAPCTTTELAKLATDPTSYDNFSDGAAASAAVAAKAATGLGMAFPTGKLMANYTIIDVVKTATFSGEAVALAPNGTANLVFFPQNGTNLTTTTLTNGVTAAAAATNQETAAGTINAVTADPLLTTNSRRVLAGATAWTVPAGADATSLITPLNVDLPDLSTPYYSTGAATGVPVTAITQATALTAALSAKSVANEYLTTTSIAATTDWVFSMPTRRYNVAMNYAYVNPLGGDGRVFTDFGAGLNYFTTTNTSVAAGKICVAADAVAQWDREETTATSGFVISPATVSVVSFCGETSVLAINNGTNTSSGSLSGSVATQNINVAATEGWLSIVHNGLDNVAGTGAWPGIVATPATVATTARGLPVIGASFAKSTSFGAVWNHRYNR